MKNILVVDDSNTMRRMVRAALHALDDVHIDEAGTGLEALERLSLLPYDLLVLDLNMPDVHGLEVLHFMRAHQSYRALPVIVLTTRGDEHSRESAMSAGASSYMTKPFAPRALADEARALLE